MPQKTERSILIIDDDTIFCHLLGRGLVKLGYTVETAHNGEQAISLVERLQPYFILLDLRLGDESGLNLIEPILSRQASARIIVLTGYASLATAVSAIKLGAINYLSKPVDAKTVDTALLESESDTEEKRSPSLPDNPTSLKRLEWEHIQRVLHENNGNISATARHFGMHRRTLQRKLKKHPPKED